MKARVDAARCQGHTLCAMIAPNVFELDDVDGHASVNSDALAAQDEAQLQEAVRSCPEQAIVLIDASIASGQEAGQ